MKKKTLTLTAAVVLCCAPIIRAEGVIINQTGAGARAFSMGSNYVALSSDLSGMFWNPAALSFLPVREFQVSTDMLRNVSNTDFAGTKEHTELSRLRLANLGILTAVPTSRGGLTFAGGLQNPYILDDNPSFRGSYINKDDQSIQIDRNYRDYGSLNFWSGAFGVQMAPGLGFGVTVSLVTGSERFRDVFYKGTNGSIPLCSAASDDFDRTSDRTYLGYDFRVGMLYAPATRLRIGARLVFPQTIWFDESYVEDYPHHSWLLSQSSGDNKGQLYSSFSGAAGVSYAFRFVTISSEVRFRAPYDFVFPEEQIDQASPAHHTKTGAGLGAEVPLGSTKTLLRAGYSWDQFDAFPFVRKYDGEPADWSSGGLKVIHDRQQLTAGLAYVDKNWCIEGGYGYQFWDLNTNNLLTEDHAFHRVLVSFSLRY